jgi:hypothetical protein
METVLCSVCEKNQTAMKCGLCEVAVCKRCAYMMNSGEFQFLAKIPAALSHPAYCSTCYHAEVEGPLAQYNEVLERAKNIDVFFKNQGKETRLVKRTEKPVVVQECFDKDEIIMRLAFFAAQAGFNSLVDVDLISEKVRPGGSYVTSKWRGTGIPANTSEKTINHDKSIWHNPN